MALKVSTPAPGKKLTVTVNNGMQGSTYNPQQTAPSTVLQNTGNPQSKTYNPQQTAPKNIQPASTAKQIADALEAQRKAVEAEVARQKEILRTKFTSDVESKIRTNMTKLTVKSSENLTNLKFTSQKNPSIKLPERTAYDDLYDEAYKEAMAEFDSQTKDNTSGFFSKAWDKISFGQDRRENDARRYAEKRANEIMDNEFPVYESRITKFESTRAKAQDEIIKFANTAKSQKEYDNFVSTKQAEIDKEYNEIVRMEARIKGLTTAFGKASETPLTSNISRTLSTVKKIASHENPIWNYTLGGGSENIPSLVTAPGRIVNFVGNLNTKDRDIYQYGGGSVKRTETGKNAWQSGFNQRNFNIRPFIDQAFDKDLAYKELQSGRVNGGSIHQTMLSKKFKEAKTDEEKQKIAEQYWNERNRTNRNLNSAKELAADPLLFLGALKSSTKVASFSSKLSESAKLSKPGQFIDDLLSKAKNSEFVKKLGKEVISPGEELAKSQQAIRDASRLQQEKLLARVERLTSKMKDVPGYDFSWYDDLKKLSDSELRIIQRMSGDGKLSFRDRALMVGRGQAPIRAKLENLARRYSEFMEQLKNVDEVNNTRFGLGKKRIYSPKTKWLDDLEDYNFRMFRRSQQVQSGEDFLHGIGDRFFKSDIDDVIVANSKHNAKWEGKLKGTWDEYGQSFKNAQGEMQEAQKRYRNKTTGVSGWLRNKKNVRSDVSFGKSLVNTANNAVHAPTRLWKSSVLKYRPAWTVNNVLYNTQANALASGTSGLVEQAKMLNPRYWRKAMDEGAIFKSNIGKEIGNTGRLNKFYSNVEDWSRVASGNALKKKGFTDEQALKKVNDYLFDYKIRNWERPIKTVIPFWSFQKNVAKASFKMPFDRPLASIAYNRTDKYQNMQYDKDFESVVPQLKELGYNDSEIAEFKKENAKYFKGRLKVGNKYITTPFNVFSQKQMSEFGVNPWLSAYQETADAEDQYGKKIGGEKASFVNRILSKFPQIELAKKFRASSLVNSGKLKPKENYIGEAGSEGFGLGKEKQGYDPSKPSYVASMDPRQKLGQDALAFLGVPRGMEFKKDEFVDSKRLQKVTDEYFKTDWRSMPFAEQQKAQEELFSRYGMTADDFYKGILSKYDTENTQNIKGLKEDARNKNQALLDEYGKQPVGTRSAWAMKKMKELSDSGYFKDNPYLYSFVKGSKPGVDQGWLTPETMAKTKSGQAKKALYQKSMATGDWNEWRKRYGVKSQKAKDYQYAKSTGDWSGYRTKYATTAKTSPFQYDGKYFKSAESMQKYKDGEFWKKYADATKADRKKLLADNPEYNTRKDWTKKQWDEWKTAQKESELARASGFGNFNQILTKFRGSNTFEAEKFLAKRKYEKRGIAFRIS